MPNGLTLKQEKYVQELIKGKSQREAYKAAYNAKNTSDKAIDVEASQLLKTGKVKTRYNELMDKREQRFLNSMVMIDEGIMGKIAEHLDEHDDVKNFIERAILAMLPIESITAEEFRRINSRGGIGAATRYGILANAGFKCQACGSKPNPQNDVELHIDHIVPYSKGGTDTASNFQVLCAKCNTSKGNRYSINHNLNLHC